MSNRDYVDYVLHDILAGVEGVTSRAMFGGYGLYKDGLIFAIVADNELYFKVDDSNRADFEAHQSRPFVYVSRGKEMQMASYWRLPIEVLENSDILLAWVERSVAISRQSQRTKKTRSTKKKQG